MVRGGCDKNVIIFRSDLSWNGRYISAMTFSEHIADPISDFGYVPVMFCYVIVMMIGGGLMVAGLMALWRKATAPSNPPQ